jgi:tRNA(Ile2) C34 agmatinyltransferase TiaS
MGKKACGHRDHKGDSGKVIIATIEDFPKSERPVCPECGSSNPVSRGAEWSCNECGRRWGKIKRKCKECPYCTEVG